MLIHILYLVVTSECEFLILTAPKKGKAVLLRTPPFELPEACEVRRAPTQTWLMTVTDVLLREFRRQLKLSILASLEGVGCSSRGFYFRRESHNPKLLL